MKPIAWIAGGLALTGLATVLESLGDPGSGPAPSLPLHLPALLALLGGQYCLWRGFRSGISALWSGAFDRRRKSSAPDTQRTGYRVADADDADGFDADAAFAHYMAQRTAGAADPAQQQQPSAPAAPQPIRPNFGRRVI